MERTLFQGGFLALPNCIASLEEFYTDAQYGSDFGYYSTGRILHQPSSQDAKVRLYIVYILYVIFLNFLYSGPPMDRNKVNKRFPIRFKQDYTFLSIWWSM